MKSIKTIIFYVVLAITSCLLLTSCYTNKKAAEQVNKAIDKKPLIALPILRGKFPCVVTGVTTTYDSSAYLAGVDSLKQLADFYKALMTNIEPTYITLYDTIYLKECANYIKEIERLKKVIIIKDKYNKELFEKSISTPPVIKENREQVEDLSIVIEKDIQLNKAQKKIDKLQESNDRWKKLFFILLVIATISWIPYVLWIIKKVK